MNNMVVDTTFSASEMAREYISVGCTSARKMICMGIVIIEDMKQSGALLMDSDGKCWMFNSVYMKELDSLKVAKAINIDLATRW